MRHALSMLVLATAVAVTAWSAAERPAAPVTADVLPVVEHSCKPLGPVALELDARPMDGSGGIPVEFTVRPLLEMKSLDWRWEISPELVVLEGELDGEAAPARGEISAGRVVLLEPKAGRHAKATLVVSGVFTGSSDDSDETWDEPFFFERSVSWGEPPVPVELVQSPDEAGQMVGVAVVPSTHTAAPAAGGR